MPSIIGTKGPLSSVRYKTTRKGPLFTSLLLINKENILCQLELGKEEGKISILPFSAISPAGLLNLKCKKN